MQQASSPAGGLPARLARSRCISTRHSSNAGLWQWWPAALHVVAAGAHEQVKLETWRALACHNYISMVSALALWGTQAGLSSTGQPEPLIHMNSFLLAAGAPNERCSLGQAQSGQDTPGQASVWPMSCAGRPAADLPLQRGNNRALLLPQTWLQCFSFSREADCLEMLRAIYEIQLTDTWLYF